MRRITFTFALAAAAAFAADNSFLLKNATVHPVSGPAINNASVLVLDGKIAEVGTKLTSKLPKKLRTLDLKGLHVYPGLIDAGTYVGIAEISSVRETSDAGEVGAFNPQLRSAVVVNPESEHIPVTRANGITSVLVLPGSFGGRRSAASDSYVQGQASLMRLDGWTWEEMQVERSAAMQMRLPTMVSSAFDPATMQVRRGSYTEGRRSYEEQMRRVRAFLDEARAYKSASAVKDPALKRDLRLEAMLEVLEGKLPVMMEAVREREIRNTVEFAEREGFKLILAGVRRPGAMLEIIAKKNIPVVLGSPFTEPFEEDDPYDEPFTLAAKLHQAGVKIAFASFGTQFARNLPYQAGQSAAFGLPSDVALRSVTLNAAEILGVGSRLGSIEVGKEADLIVTTGDPLEIRTEVKQMFIAGKEVDLESRHTRLYEKYLNRP